MKNLFSSPNTHSDLQKFVIKQLDYLLTEQRAQRVDLASLLRLMNRINHNLELQKQVDEYFDKDDTPSPPEVVDT